MEQIKSRKGNSAVWMEELKNGVGNKKGKFIFTPRQ
jgi:hypothetical protein